MIKCYEIVHFEIITELSDWNHSEGNNESNMNQKCLEPFVGMEFESLEEALEYYTMYAKSEGFGIRKSRITKSWKAEVIIGQEFFCSEESYRAKKYLEREDRI